MTWLASTFTGWPSIFASVKTVTFHVQGDAAPALGELARFEDRFQRHLLARREGLDLIEQIRTRNAPPERARVDRQEDARCLHVGRRPCDRLPARVLHFDVDEEVRVVERAGRIATHVTRMRAFSASWTGWTVFPGGASAGVQESTARRPMAGLRMRGSIARALNSACGGTRGTPCGSGHGLDLECT